MILGFHGVVDEDKTPCLVSSLDVVIFLKTMLFKNGMENCHFQGKSLGQPWVVPGLVNVLINFVFCF